MEIFKAEKLCKQYGTHKVLSGVDLTVEEGDIYGFVGKNGAGKSTFMKVITGLVSVSGGSYNLFGVNNRSKSIYTARRQMSGIIEAPAFYPHMSAFDNLKVQLLSSGHYERQSIIDALDSVGLENTRKHVRNYSLGMKQRLSIAQAIINHSRFVILDEPTNGLDPQGILELRALIKKLNTKQGMTFLISSHYLTELQQIINRIGILDNGIMILENDMATLSGKLQHTLSIASGQTIPIEKITGIFAGYKMDVHENRLIFSGDFPEINDVTKAFSDLGLTITDINKTNETLENYVLGILNGGVDQNASK